MSTPRSTSHARFGYVPALDGLRALAVLSVMLYHGGIVRVSGGFLGVDLFFVLSGYLITTLLLRELTATGRIALGDFYVRRIRRLAPALLLFVLGVAIYSHVRANPYLLPVVRRDVASTLEYWANWRFITSHQSYFAQFIPPSPVRHVWSLSVEEQWYLVWPVVLLLLVKVFRRLEIVLGIVLALALGSAGWMAHLVRPLTDPSRAYYGSDSRAHTLLIGAALGLALHRWPAMSARVRLWAQVVGGAALALAVMALFVVHGWDYWMYQGGYLAFAVLCALAINGVMAATTGPVARALSVRPLPWIGRISYGLYLWHWLVDVWITPQYLQASFAVTLVVRLAITFALATASYYLVERPIRTAKWERLRTPRMATVTGFAAALLLAFMANGWGTRIRAVSAAPVVHVRPPAASLPSDMRVLVVGDSVGWSIAWGVPKQHGLKIIDAAIIGCGVLPGDLYVNGVEMQQQGVPPCSTAPKNLERGLSAKPQVVVLSFGAWEVYDHIIGGRRIPFYSGEYRRLLAAKLGSELDTIAAQTTVPIVVLDAPCMHQENFALGDATSPRNDSRRVAVVNRVLHQVAAARTSRVTVVPWSKWLCPGGKFLVRRDGVVVRPDGVHLDQRTSSPLLWDWLRPQLVAIRRRAGAAPATVR
jgi:peptidoglycan/LPS O-acetylase OafA/YrhL